MQWLKTKWLLGALAITIVGTAIWVGLMLAAQFNSNQTKVEFELEARLLTRSIEQWKSKPAMLGGAGSRPLRSVSFSDIKQYKQRTDSLGHYHGIYGRFWFTTQDVPSPCVSEADFTRERDTAFLIGYNEDEDMYVCHNIR